MNNKLKVSVLGANPSWQKTLFFETLLAGKINRAKWEKNYPSGKGVNFCRALRYSRLAEFQIFQFAGGNNGKLLCEALDADNFQHHTVVTETETRNCITCLDPDGNMTELIGASYPVSTLESQKMLDNLKEFLPGSAILAVTGSLPDGTSPDLYIKAAELAVKYNMPVLIDALAGIDGILSLPGKVILKVNQEEFFNITGQSEIIDAHRFAAGKFPDKIFAITNGPGEATLSDGKHIYRYRLPEIKVVNPLGSGDTASAVMTALFASGIPAGEAFKQALAAASANCLNETAGMFDPAESSRLAEKTGISMENLR